MKSQKRLAYRPEIDGLRAVAVLPVILFHAGISQMSGGYIGVDIFFVISGYLITGILVRELEAEQFSLLSFYERRARRILPALFLVLSVTAVIGAFVMLPYELEGLGRGIVSVLLFASNVLFWRESGYFAPASELNPLLHTWSLAVEEQYYIVFPVVMWASWRWFPRAGVLLLGLVTIGSLVLAEVWSVRMPSANFYLLPTRAWELLAGSLTALYLSRRCAPKGVMAEIIGIAGLTAIVFAILTIDATTPFPSLWALAPVLGTVAIIVAANPATLVGKLLGAAPFVGIGLISYSAYLWHQPLFAFARMLDPGNHPHQGVMLILAAASLILAWLSWRYVERPFRSKSAVAPGGVLAFSGVGSVGLAAFAAVVISSNGLPERFPPEKRAWVENGPLEYGEFVREAYRDINGAPLSEDRPNLILVGDSFSQDFYNIVRAAGAFEGYAISAIYVPVECQVHFGLPSEVVEAIIQPEHLYMCENRMLNASDVDKMQGANVVIFAARWNRWSAAKMHESLASMALQGEVIVVGSKSFEKNRRALLKFDPSQLEFARKAPSERSRETSEILERNLPDGQFVNILKRMCVTTCPQFTDDGELISYDGRHLTPAGAAYLGKLVFDEGALSRYVQTSDERRSEKN